MFKSGLIDHVDQSTRRDGYVSARLRTLRSMGHHDRGQRNRPEVVPP